MLGPNGLPVATRARCLKMCPALVPPCRGLASSVGWRRAAAHDKNDDGEDDEDDGGGVDDAGDDGDDDEEVR